MANYNVAFSGLDNVSKAIDTVSNNIANAQTVGYKAGQWVFADQFMKAVSSTDSARTGMGTQNLSVRRPMIQGTITNSANPLDLAISGKGLFRLLQRSGIDSPNNKVDPSALYYTRNGQFGVDREGFIVNENGMYLTGFQPNANHSDTNGDLYGKTAGRIAMPKANLSGNETTHSYIGAMLDSTGSAFTSNANVSFDPTQNTFNSKTTQTVFDNEGNSHTVEIYYRRVGDTQMSIKSMADGTGYTYSPSKSSTPNTLGATLVTLNANSVLKVDTAPLAATVASASSNGTTITLSTLPSNAGSTVSVGGKRIFVNGVDSGMVVNSASASAPFTVTANGNVVVPNGAQISFYAGNESQTTAAAMTTSTNMSLTAATTNNVTGYRVYVGGVDTGATVLSGGQTDSLVLSKAVSAAIGATITFKPNLDMTLETPDGTQITLQGATNKKNSGENLYTNMAKVEVYASIDGRFYDYNDSQTISSRSLSPQTPGVLGYRAVSELNFIGGRNIDALVVDPVSGNPTFRTETKLSTRVVGAGGGSTDVVFDLDLTDTSLQAGAFQVTKSTQNGAPLSRLTNVTIDNQGRIVGVYGNGKQELVGQVALVHFDAFEKLIPVGKNAFAASVESGTEESVEGVLVGRAGTGEFGEIKSQALESSNVDLSGELVHLMMLQRTYSANSQSMKAIDSAMRDTLQMVS
jgi:flagellar hook protein FlgE